MFNKSKRLQKRSFSLIILFIILAVSGCSGKEHYNGSDKQFFQFLRCKPGQEDVLLPDLNSNVNGSSAGVYKTELLRTLSYENAAAFYIKIYFPDTVTISCDDIIGAHDDNDLPSVKLSQENDKERLPLSVAFSKIEIIEYNDSDNSIKIGLILGSREPFTEGMKYSVSLSELINVGTPANIGTSANSETVAFTWVAEKVRPAYYINVEKEELYSGEISLSPIAIRTDITILPANEKIVIDAKNKKGDTLFSHTVSDGNNPARTTFAAGCTNKIFDLKDAAYIEIAGDKYCLK